MALHEKQTKIYPKLYSIHENLIHVQYSKKAPVAMGERRKIQETNIMKHRNI